LRYVGYMKYMQDVRDIRHLRFVDYMGDASYIMHVEDLRDLLLTSEVAEKAKKQLYSTDPVHYVDLLMILLGRLIQIQKLDEISTTVELEIQDFANIAKNSMLLLHSDIQQVS